VDLTVAASDFKLHCQDQNEHKLSIQSYPTKLFVNPFQKSPLFDCLAIAECGTDSIAAEAAGWS
jgi:hypothetical protein